MQQLPDLKRRDRPQSPALCKIKQSRELGDSYGKSGQQLLRNWSLTITSRSKKDYVEDWVSQTCSSQGLDEAKLLLNLSENNMPGKTKATKAFPSPDKSVDGTATLSKISDRSSRSEKPDKSVSVHDPCFRRIASDGYNIHIMEESPPEKLLQNAKAIIFRDRDSPDIDDIEAKRLSTSARRVQNKGESDVAVQMGNMILPYLNTTLGLEVQSDALWSNAAPLPPDPVALCIKPPRPLSIPKPDRAFGYAVDRFTRMQRLTIDSLTNHFGQNFAEPLPDLRFPSVDIEFKSQAKGGSLYVATNQAALAGAVALYGMLNSMDHELAVHEFDLNEPYFFSIVMDQLLARVCVHWVEKPTGKDQASFHLDVLASYVVDEATSIKALIRATRNIFDWALNERLTKLRNALDARWQRITSGNDGGTSKRKQDEMSSTSSSTEESRGSKRVQQPTEEVEENLEESVIEEHVVEQSVVEESIREGREAPDDREQPIPPSLPV